MADGYFDPAYFDAAYFDVQTGKQKINIAASDAPKEINIAVT